MKIAMIIIASLVALVALILFIGALLPRKHVAARQIMLRRSPAEVYAVIRDFASAPSWRSDVKKTEMLEDIGGRVRFREKSNNGLITYEVIEDTPDKKLTTRIMDRDLGYFGSWTYEFLPVENGTRVRITEVGEVPNVLFRFMSRFVFGQTATIEAYLVALGKKFGENVTPE